MSKILLSIGVLLLVVVGGNSQTTVFSENIGSPAIASTSIASYTGWQQNGFLTFSGTGEVSNANVSSSYSSASAGGNVLLTNTGKKFEISNINTISFASVVLSFGLYKSTASSTGTDLNLEVSTDGTTYFSIKIPSVLSGVAGWSYIVASGNLPLTSNLRIRWTNNGNSTQYRIDDVKLTQAVRYFDKAGASDLSLLNSWSTTPDGMGASPTNFTSEFQLFNEINNEFPAVLNNWTISGTGSSLIIGNGSFVPTLTVANGVALNIGGSGDGTSFTISNGALQLNPASIFTVGASAIADFNNRQIILKSDASGTANIGRISGNLVNANSVTVERYIPSNNRKSYILVSSPVNGSSIRSAWQEGGDVVVGYGTHITGSGSGYDINSLFTSTASIFKYDDYALPGSKWITLGGGGTNANSISAGTGYLLYMRGDRAENRPETGNSSNTTLRATGTVVTGNVTYNTSSNPFLVDGIGKYSLVANPYPCTIDWTTGITKTNIENVFYVYDPNLGVFVTCNGVTTSPFSGTGISQQNARYIQSGQAFFIKSSAVNPSITITEASKAPLASSDISQTVFSEDNKRSQLNINVIKTQEKAFADGVVAVFNNSYKAGIGKEDATKFNNFNENICLIRNGEKLSIEGRPFAAVHDTLYLSFNNFSKKEYTLTIDGNNFKDTKAVLVDKYTGTKQPINVEGNTLYNFTVNGETESTGDRFLITFENTAPQIVVSDDVADSRLFVKLSPNPVIDQLLVNFKTASVENTVINVVNSLGQIVRTVNAGKVNAGNITISVATLSPGFYTVQLIGNDRKIAAQKIIKK